MVMWGSKKVVKMNVDALPAYTHTALPADPQQQQQ